MSGWPSYYASARVLLCGGAGCWMSVWSVVRAYHLLFWSQVVSSRKGPTPAPALCLRPSLGRRRPAASQRRQSDGREKAIAERLLESDSQARIVVLW